MAAYDSWRTENPDYYVSARDDELARNNPHFANALIENKNTYYQGGDAQAAHRGMESARDLFGSFSGGTQGNENNPLNPYETAFNNANDRFDLNGNIRSLYANLYRQGEDRLNAQRGDVNQAYDQNARDAYTNYMLGQRNMNERLASAGITGGATETALMGARTGYENNLTGIENDRQKALNDVNTAINDLRNTASVEEAQAILQNAQSVYANFIRAQEMDRSRADTLKQQEFDNSLNVAGLTGYYGGSPTMQRENMTWGQNIDTANLTGMYGGQPTWQAQMDLAGLTGMHNGQPTMAGRDAYLNHRIGQEQLRQMQAQGGGGSGGGSGGGRSSGGNSVRVADQTPVTYEGGNIASYADAVSTLEENGIDSSLLQRYGVMDQNNFVNNWGSAWADLGGYSSYEDYLTDKVGYILNLYGKR